MDPVTVILTALVAGTSSAAVQESSRALCAAVRNRLARAGESRDGAAAEAGADVSALEAYLRDPAGQRERLARALALAEAGTDTELIAAARGVLAMTRPAGSAAIDSHLDLREARGVVVGDHAEQKNYF
ncbi:hypothetical protein SSP531S_14000 [Streptomyces spongiicola]|uniref:Uncharacterized protein n=1 Tax=Streptomyces spongiicola TaxID=1690221 RepID=A0A388SV82_9ACTN|nr:hypothetical protein [Streptomyces spongiicola]GBP99993.1 hypothetical protein SSP531S_14000 [Streptomyces spongiicola]